MAGNVYIGVAGWSLPSPIYEPRPGFAPKLPLARFGEGGSHLERYARVYGAVEVNSTFYRMHEAKTFERWAKSVPPGFRFSVKLAKEITHDLGLAARSEPLSRFLAPVRALGPAMGPLLIQLPPSRAFDARRAGAFFRLLRKQYEGAAVLEARHESWFEPPASKLLTKHGVHRVIADPAPIEIEPGPEDRLVYYRLHGSPRMYYSGYEPAFLDELAAKIATLRKRSEVWAIFDNTAAGFAHGDALGLIDRLAERVIGRPQPLFVLPSARHARRRFPGRSPPRRPHRRLQRIARARAGSRASPRPPRAPSPALRASASAPPGPPIAPVRDIADTYFGTTVIDPYRWMETDSPELSTWMKGQADHTRGLLDALPLHAELAARVRALDNAGSLLASARRRGGKIVYLGTEGGKNTFKLQIRYPHGNSTILVDPDALATSEQALFHRLLRSLRATGASWPMASRRAARR